MGFVFMTLIFYFHIEHRGKKRKILVLQHLKSLFLKRPFFSVNIQWSVLAASVACNAALCAERSLCGVAIVDDGTTGGLRRGRLVSYRLSECFSFIVYFSRLHLISSHLSHTLPRGLNPY